MFKTGSLTALLSLGLSLGGCAAITNLRGGSPSTSSSSASTTSSPASTTSSPARTGSGHARAASSEPTQGAAFVSGKLNYDQVARSDNAHVLFRRMGAEHSHPLSGANPDPAWIPGWAKLSNDEGAEVAIAQAAVNRTWMDAVNAEFATWWSVFGPVADAQRAEIEKIETSTDSHYAKTAALQALWASTGKSPAAAQAYGKYLLQFQIASAAARIHKAANAEFATYPFIVALGADTGLASHGRALGTEAQEREQFVFSAMNGDLQPSLPALPRMDNEGNGKIAVMWPLDAGVEKEIAAARAAAAEEGKTLMAKPADVPSFDTGAAPGIVVYLSSQGQDDIANGLTSKKVTAIGKDTITIVGKRSNKIPYDCREQIGHDQAGMAQLQQDCKYKDDDTKITVTLEVDELPVKLQIGDQIDARGTVKDYRFTKGAINARLEDVYIEAVQRGSKRMFGNG